MIPPHVAAFLETAPARIQRKFTLRRQAIAALDAAPFKLKHVAARLWARRIHVRPNGVFNLRTRFRKHGAVALLDRRYSSALWKSPLLRGLPVAFERYLETLSTTEKLSRPQALRLLTVRLARWRGGHARAAIPGYTAPPQGNPPPGWSARNLARHLAANPCAEVLVKLRADGSTRIMRGKLANITRHPLFSSLNAARKSGNA